MNNKFDALLDSYIEERVGIDINFLSQELSDGLCENIRRLQAENKMFSAGIGNEAIKDKDQQMRGDSICWLDKSHDNIFEQEFLTLAENFTERLNKTCYAGINSCEFHYAVYPEGSSYKKHRDSFKNDDSRKFSFINYLNNDWEEADGGQLWIHHGEHEIQRILPRSGTAVFFNSAVTAHEVTVSHRQRMSISGWLKRI